MLTRNTKISTKNRRTSAVRRLMNQQLFEFPISRYPFVGWSARVSTEATPVERKYRLAVTLSDARRGAIAVSHSGKDQFTRGFSSSPCIPFCISKREQIGIRKNETCETNGRYTRYTIQGRRGGNVKNNYTLSLSPLSSLPFSLCLSHVIYHFLARHINALKIYSQFTAHCFHALINRLIVHNMLVTQYASYIISFSWRIFHSALQILYLIT